MESTEVGIRLPSELMGRLRPGRNEYRPEGHLALAARDPRLGGLVTEFHSPPHVCRSLCGCGGGGRTPASVSLECCWELRDSPWGRLPSLRLPTFDQRQAWWGAFSSRQGLQIVVILRARVCPEPRPSPRAIIHYAGIFHRPQLALEGNELINMHRLILINYAFAGRASRLCPATEGLLTRLLVEHTFPPAPLPSRQSPCSSAHTSDSGSQRVGGPLGRCVS